MRPNLQLQIQKLQAVDGRELMRLGIYEAVTLVCGELERQLAVKQYEGQYNMESFTPEFVAHLDTGTSGQLCLPLWEVAWMCGVRAWETQTGDAVTSDHAKYDVRHGRPYRQSWESALADTRSNVVTMAEVMKIMNQHRRLPG